MTRAGAGRLWLAVAWAAALGAGCDDGAPVAAGEVDAYVDRDARPLPDEPDGAPDAPDGALDAGVDAGPDAAPPRVPDEPPTPGEPDLPGADDLTVPAAVGTARAGRVDADDERITGVEAHCRVGDFRLDNAVIALCIQAERSYGQFTFAGGNLIDAIRVDPEAEDWLHGDYLREVIHTIAMGEVSVERIGIVRDGADGGPAVIRTEGTAGGALIIQGILPGSFVPPPLPVVTEFRLAPDSDAVDILTWVGGRDTPALVRVVDLFYGGDQTRPFPPVLGIGDTPDLLVAEAPGVSYGWSRPDGPLGIFPLVALDLLPVTATQSDQLSLRPGDTALVRRRLQIGSGDVESVRRPSPEAAPLIITGPPGLRLDVDGPEPTRVLLDAEGRATAMVAPGAYGLTAHDWPGGAFTEVVQVTPAGAEAAVAPPEPATLRISVRDADGAPLVARVDLAGPAGRRVLVRDDRALRLPAGAWTMETTRGWHYTVDTRAFDLVAGEALDVEVVLEEVIPLEGWAAGEFHQHASPSIDSEIPVLDRVLANLAEGVQFMVPSEHDVIYDYQGLAAREGLADRIVVPFAGVEISPTFTHIGAYGLRYDAHAGAGGAPPLPILEDGQWRIRTVPELVASARERGAGLVQMNHARESSGLFTHTGYTAETPVEELPADRFTADFDSMEIANRASDTCQLLADWMGLLNQGLRVTGVGNSDSHSLGASAGYPRNYVPALDPARVTAEEIIGAVQAGQVFVGGGAVMDFPDGRLPGDEIELDADVLPLRVRVRTPPYAAVHRIVAFVDGAQVAEVPVESAAADIVDFDGVIEVPVERDGSVILLALGDDALAHVRPSRPVFALSNPLWVDRDGGGVTPVGPGPVTPIELPGCD